MREKRYTGPIEGLAWYAPPGPLDDLHFNRFLEHIQDAFEGRIEYGFNDLGGVTITPAGAGDYVSLDQIMWMWYGHIFHEIEQGVIPLL